MVCVYTSICAIWANFVFGIGIVENVRDGSTVRVRLLLSDGEHQFVNIAMAGVRTPRTSTKQGDPAEQWGEEVIPIYPVISLSRALILDIVGGRPSRSQSRDCFNGRSK